MFSRQAVQKPLPDYSNPESLRTMHDKFLAGLLDTTKRLLGGPQFVRVAYLQPHFALPDVTFRTDRQGHPLPASEWTDSDGGDRYAVIAAKGEMYYRDLDWKRGDLLGELRFKKRQLAAAGYSDCAVVPHGRFFPLGPEGRMDSLKQILRREIGTIDIR